MNSDSYIDIDTSYFYNPNKIYSKLDNIPNPFVNLIRDKKVQVDNGMILYAIVSSNILINNVWYKLNDIVNNKKIVSFGLNSVELIDIKNGNKIFLKVHSEER